MWSKSLKERRCFLFLVSFEDATEDEDRYGGFAEYVSILGCTPVRLL